MNSRTIQIGLLIILPFASIGCQSNSVQMTSGKKYLSNNLNYDTTETNALLLNVCNGYPYGNTCACLNAKEFSANQTYRDKSRNLADKNQISTVIKLSPEVQKMMKKLIKESKQA